MESNPSVAQPVADRWHQTMLDGSARERGPDTLMSGQTLFDDAEQTDIPWRTGTVTSNVQHGWEGSIVRLRDRESKGWIHTAIAQAAQCLQVHR